MLQLITTADGSKTIFNAEIGESYHSRHGALQESRHVFLNSGLGYFLEKNSGREVKILEVGFGTGLNFLLTADYCTKNQLNLYYTGIEAYPLTQEMLTETGYNQYVPKELWDSFYRLYPEALNNRIQVDDFCRLHIAACKVVDFTGEQADVIYFDAFAAIHQPEMWTEKTLSHVCTFLKPGGVFVTYAITGNLKRILKALGFSIEKAPGAPGKREMLRAVKKI